VADVTPALHPGHALLQDPLQEESRRHRRALLAVSSICLAVCFTDSFPRQISALGISVPGSHERSLIWLAIGLQFYLLVAFALSALTDYLRWRYELCQKMDAYVQANRTTTTEFNIDTAVEAAMDQVMGTRFRLEAPRARMNQERLITLARSDIFIRY
jgi:hypothetical protein